ncbi:MAG TPA: TetR/AcrR family transcriptional regulator [Candidatus Limnocylindrales bacterium]|nr:TetR/AcrR family transcriptional regulator [Candidatus Limnocylindrales bacterium]
MGRARAFDLDEALDRAMLVFWRLGYERATIAELTSAMGINRPSLYAAFGSKEELFRRALDRYASGPNAYEARVLELPTAREVALALLRGAADRQTQPGRPHGCLAVLGTRTNGADSSPIGRMLIEAREVGEAEVRERFERARDDGDLPPDADPGELAVFVRTVIYGLTVKAASGATRDELERVIERAMRAWPD